LWWSLKIRGGLTLYWDESLDVLIHSFSHSHIDVSVRDTSVGQDWRATFVHGDPRVQNRHRVWSKLRHISAGVSGPWIVIGDFNETCCQYEHFSKIRRSEAQMAAFRSALSDCGLIDIGFRGLPWTYDNKQVGERNVKVRLDHAVANTNYLQMFPDSLVEHLVSSRSDHCPILL
jgi:endonuclease/exonuclease/phosphatase family metal-dependent hydrolase